MMIRINEGVVVSVMTFRQTGDFDVRWVVRDKSGRLINGGGTISVLAVLTLAQGRFSMAEGDLLYVSVRCKTSTVAFGSARVSAVVQQLPLAGDSVVRSLFDLPVGNAFLAQWSSTQGAGTANNPDPVGWFFGTDPGLGSDWTQTLADWVITELVWVGFQFTCSAAVATRWPIVQIQSGTAASTQWALATGMTAGQQFNLRFGSFLQPATFTAFQIQASLPPVSIAATGLRTQINNLQAGDNVHEITVGCRWRLAPATV
jgi:hypothetical protein